MIVLCVNGQAWISTRWQPTLLTNSANQEKVSLPPNGTAKILPQFCLASAAARKAALPERRLFLAKEGRRSQEWPQFSDGLIDQMSQNSSANVIIIEQLRERIRTLESITDGDVIVVCAPIRFGLDGVIRGAIERLPKRRRKLSVILETEGGYIEVAQRIAQIFRRYYRTVDFIVPNYAYSAGTVLVMAGDEILMDYFSVLGPIDPQLPKEDKWFRPLDTWSNTSD